MPELPEVETTRLAIAPQMTGQTISGVTLRAEKLRLPLAPELPELLLGQRIESISRRGKYLLFGCTNGTLLLHLGMTGHLRLVDSATPPGKHDHVELHLGSGSSLRFHDPRKFGTLLWLTEDPYQHPLLADQGPEPLSPDFTAEYLYSKTRRRSVAIKTLIMNSKIVAGVGNIYANEALFLARISPLQTAGSLTMEQVERLTLAIKKQLEEAIRCGGATLHDYLQQSDNPEYFPLELNVYGRGAKPCSGCGGALREDRLGGRSTVWCPVCQAR